MIIGDLEALGEGSSIVLGNSLAYELNVALGDTVNLLNIDQSNLCLEYQELLLLK